MLLCARDQYGRFLADDGKLRFRRGLVGDQAVDLLPVGKLDDRFLPEFAAVAEHDAFFRALDHSRLDLRLAVDRGAGAGMAQHAVRADQRNIRAQRPQRSERPHADAGQARRADLSAEGVDRIVAVCEQRRDLGRVRHDRQPVPQGEQARRAKVPVAVHLDHTYSFELLMQALRAGFGSVMYDGSREKTSEENIRKSAEIVRIAHGMGVGVECELGSVGGLTDSNGKVDQMVYTEPEEAKSFVDQTGTDFLAVSIGTCHGVYKATPKLDIPRLREIRKTVSVPLVLHGGSGLSDGDFRNTVAGGISKINVFTDVILAAKRAIAEHPDAGYTDLNLLAEDAMVEATVRKLELFGGCGKG